MVERGNPNLTLTMQAELLGINRTSLYYTPRPPSEEDLAIKAAIDRIYTAHPEFGYRRVTAWLRDQNAMTVNHKAVQRHMQEMGIQAIYPRPRTSLPNTAHKVYPYLLNGLKIAAPNHVWSIDITYVPIRGSWLYLVAIIDWYSRYVVSWAIDDTLEIDFVLDACARALHTAVPAIMNSDQGSHFTSPKYTELFLKAGAEISMDHRGRAYDNIFIERMWRTVKYENVYLREYQSPREARAGIGEFMRFYNDERPHQSLNNQPPAAVYLGTASRPVVPPKPR